MGPLGDIREGWPTLYNALLLKIRACQSLKSCIFQSQSQSLLVRKQAIMIDLSHIHTCVGSAELKVFTIFTDV